MNSETKTYDAIRFLAQVKSAGFVIEVIAEQDDCEVRGNALASGDDAADRECEDTIIERLNNGDVWAWASVAVKVSHPAWPEIEGVDYLGCCSYADEADFTAYDGYYPDMVREAPNEWHALAIETVTFDAVTALNTATEIING